MGNEYESGFAFTLHREHQVDNLVSRARVKIACRLVGEDNLRFRDERPRERDALLLAARKLAGIMLKPIRKANGTEFAGGKIEGAGFARQLQRYRDILERGHGRNQMKCLEDDADTASAKQRKFVFGHMGDIAAIDVNGARCRPLQPSHNGHQRRLARAAGPHQSDGFTAFDLEVDTAKNVDRAG